MTKAKHSYIQFYPSDWMGGVVGLPRIVVSVYFDICLYNWDKVKPMALSHYRLITSDIPPEQSDGILQMLVEAGKIIQDGSGLYSPRAMAEAERALDLWEKRSTGGKARRAGKPEDTWKTLQRHIQESSTEPEPEPEPEPDSPSIEGENPLPPLKKSEESPESEPDEDDIAIAKIEQAQAKSAAIKKGMQQVADAWNVMAAGNRLSQIERMTDARKESLRARVVEHGADAIIEWLRKIPESPFLMGQNERRWKANFDFLIRPDNCTRLIEGQYHIRGDGDQGKASGWR